MPYVCCLLISEQYYLSLQIIKPKPQVKWTDEDKQKLLQLVEQNTIKGRIQWVKIASSFQSRSANECKMQYNFVLTNKEYINRNLNHVWDQKQVFELCALVHHFGKKWEFIRKNYFHDLSALQLKTKYFKIQQFIQQKQKDMESLLIKNEKIDKDRARQYLQGFDKFKQLQQCINENFQNLQKGIPVSSSLLSPIEISYIQDIIQKKQQEIVKNFDNMSMEQIMKILKQKLEQNLE